MKNRIFSFLRFKEYSALFLLLVLSASISLGQCLRPVIQLNPPVTPPASQLNRQSIVVGNFDNDANNTMDFVTANLDVATISYLKGNGGGSFATPTDITLGVSVQTSFVTSADLNKDNYLDIIVVYSGNSTSNGGLKVLLNTKNSANPFTAVTNYSFGVNVIPTWVATGDFNNDNYIDLAVTNRGNNTLSILLGNVNGTFSTSGANFISVTTNYAGLSQPWGIVSTDFNKDNKLDLAVSMSSGNRVLLFFGDGTGSFGATQTPSSTPKQITLGSSNSPRAVASTDFNNDTFPDLAVANNGSGNITVCLYNSSTATFGAATNYDVGNTPTGITYGDFNGDGTIDLATSNAGPSNISILNGQGLGVFNSNQVNFTCTNGALPQAIIAADLDGDNLLDLVTPLINNGVASRRGINFFYAQRTPAPSAIKLNCSITLNIAQQSVGDMYSVNGGSFQISNNFVNIQPGIYTIVTKNTNGCATVYPNYEVTPLKPVPTLRPDDVIVGQPTCSVQTAIITITTSDDISQSATYKYSINNGADYYSANIFTDQPPGPYPFTAKIKNSEGCESETQNKQVKNFKPDLLLDVTNESICDNGFSTIQLSDNNEVGDVSFSWTAETTNVVNVSQGNATLINDALTLINKSQSGSITYTIVASSGADEACKSTKVKTISVGAVPTLEVQNTIATVCGNSGTANILLTNSNNVDGTFYELTSTSTNVSVTNNFSTNLITDQYTLINATIPGNLTYTIRAVAGICKSSSLTTSIDINPTPELDASYSSTLCSGASTNILLTSTTQVLGAEIDWSINSNSVNGGSIGNNIPIPSDGRYTIAQALRVFADPDNITYTITPKFTANGFICSGTSKSVTITVNPIPSITVENKAITICSGGITNISVSNANQVSGALVDWTVSPNSFTGGNNASFDTSGNLTINQALANAGNFTSSVAYTITPKFTNNGVTCYGPSSIPIMIAVNPIPSIGAANATSAICSGSSTNISITNINQVSGASIDWTISPNSFPGASVGDVGFNSNGNATIAQVLTNSGDSPASISYTITPKFTNSGVVCMGANSLVTITVNPLPAVLGGKNTTICSGSESAILEAEIGNKYKWELVYEFGLKGDLTPFGQSEKFILNLNVDQKDNNQTGAAIYKMSRVSNTTNCISDPSYFVIGVSIDLKRVIDFEVTNLCSGTSTKFKPVYSSDQTIESFTWNFGDGNSTILKEASHTYATNGEPVTYNVTLTASASDGGCPISNTKQITLMPVKRVEGTAFYKEDFEQGGGIWKQVALNNETSKISWKNGIPNSMLFPGSTNAWYTDNYFPNENSAVMGPCFNISNLKRPMISLDYYADTQKDYDGAVLQYFDRKKSQWLNIGQKDFGINWYNSIGIASNPGDQASNQFQSGWSGNKKWSTGRFRLDSIPIDQRDLVALRLAFATDGADPSGTSYKGFAFDNFFVGDKQRTVLVEQFENYSIPISIDYENYINQLFDSQVQLNGYADFNPISYHINYPGRDTLNLANPEEPSARAGFYGITSPPVSIMNGYIGTSFNPGSNPMIAIDTASLADTKFDLTLKATKGTTDTKLNIELLINANSDFNNPILAYIVLIDNSIGPFKNVVRKQLLGADGKLINQKWVTGQSLTITLTDMEVNKPVFNPNNLSLVAFVQDKITRKVYQSLLISCPPVKHKVITGTEISNNLPRDLTLFPNPAFDQLNFYYPLGANSWSIVNQLGIEILSGNIGISSNNSSRIDIKGLSEGVYYFKLSVGETDKPVIKKLIVINK